MGAEGVRESGEEGTGGVREAEFQRWWEPGEIEKNFTTLRNILQ